ncbi:MAG: cytidylate kinase [Candidatus Tokpelaia sp. JSC161]|jgi:cytidylate kinase|nr:MAG: cytidylate kinase [Candidatus Tokpelaia sp. JSC161]
MVKPFIIAIDGLAASGKGTLARQLAKYYSLPYLDTGLTYRAVARSMLENNIKFSDEETAIQIAKQLNVLKLNPNHLHALSIAEAASKISILPGLRFVLSQKQRKIAQTMPGAVLDGRDIGTVICPNADIKFYIVASIKERAKRRYLQIKKEHKAIYKNILSDLKNRDQRDINRVESPLQQAKDALLLNSTKLSINELFEAACQLIENKKASSPIFF